MSKIKVIKTNSILCLSCMEKHNVDIIELREEKTYKGVDIEFNATYEYCSYTNEYLETEEMLRINDLALKDAYRSKVGLLTSEDIKNIREKYSISQKDFSEILDWGKATITRYENNQVQDRAHDDILRKLASDPKWLLEMLKRSQSRLSKKAFAKYYCEVNKQYGAGKNAYLIDAIYAQYADITDTAITGGRELNIAKVIEVINYLAKAVPVHGKIKLMQLLWHADLLNFKRHGNSITGLAYRALPQAVVPEGFEQIISLDGVSLDTICENEHITYRFSQEPGFEVNKLSFSEVATLDRIISELGALSTAEIIDKIPVEANNKPITDHYLNFHQAHCIFNIDKGRDIICKK